MTAPRSPLSLSLATVLGLSTLAGFVSSAQAQSQAQFECAFDENNIPTTFVQTPDGIVQIFKWKSTWFNPPYTPAQRCQEVTNRLNQFQPDYLVTGRVNNYNVICAGTQCYADGSNLLLTLRPDQSPAQVLQEIDNTRDGVGGPSMQLSGGGNKVQRGGFLSTSNDGGTLFNLQGYIDAAPRLPLNGTSTSAPAQSPQEVLQQPPTALPTPSNSGSQRGRSW